jgi:hypothetical protein
VAPEGNIATQLPANEVLRWNWNPGFLISPHNPSVIYFGANRLFKSYNRGDSWIATKDLTKGLDRNTLPIMGKPGSEPMPSKNDGVGQWGTIAAIAESPVLPGVLWVGTDDGSLQVSQDGGSTWTSVADNAAKFPTPVYVEFVEASNFDPATAYVVFDAHHSGDFRPHLYKTTDYGKTWTSLSANLPEHGHLNVVKEDRINRNLLFVGTERGFFVSLDAGKAWAPLMNGLSATIADDVLVHPRDQDLVLATLGRSFYILDDITPLQQLTPEVMAKNEHLFKPRPSILWDHDRTAWHGGGADRFRAKNPPDAIFSYYLKGAASSAVRLQVVDAAGTVVRDLEGPRDAGIQRVTWDLRKAAPPRPAGQGGGGGAPAPGDFIAPGDYVIRMTANGRTESAVWRVNEDPNR